MPVLDCSVRTFYYNKENSCCLEGIKVEGSAADKPSATACASFRKKTGDTLTNKCTCSMDPTVHSSVDCMATHCIHNSGQYCVADKIGICGSSAKRSEDTECGTFEKK